MQSLYKNKQFLGWSKSSTATTASYSSGGNLGTVSASTILYAVWKDRDSVTINPSVSDITTITFDNTPDASDGLTYYFNRGTNKKVTISIDANATGSEEYYINSVSGATGTITANGQRSWVGNNVTNNGSSAVVTTINITYHKNLKFYLHNYFIERTSFDPTTQLNTLTVSGTNSFFTQTDTNYKDKYQSIFLNPGDSIIFAGTMTNPNYYIARVHIPNTSNSMSDAWNGSYSEGSSEITNTISVDRLILKNTYNGNNVSASINDANYRDYSYTYTIPTGSTGIALMGDALVHNFERGYIVYEPFHCQIQLTNTNYSPSISRSTDLTNAECLFVSGTPRIYRFFNDVELTNSQYIYCYRQNNSTNNVIISISIDNISNELIYPVLQNGTSKINNLFYFPQATSRTIGSYNYYMDRFLRVYIQPNISLLKTYHAPYNIDINWNNTDYKCIIILRLPEANEDNNTTETDSNIVWNKIDFNGTGWTYLNDTTRNKRIYFKEIYDTTSNSINTTLQDVASSGYILKSVKKYSYNGTYGSTLTTSTVTREELDAGTGSLPTGWTRSSSATSNDILTLNQTSLTSGAIDYYFITYEEGLPVFYPDGENNPKRAIQLYWEGNRAIGLYYENTRLL